MPFWLNDPAFLVFLKKISSRQRLFFSVGVFSLIFIGSMLWIFMPLRRQCEHFGHQEQQLDMIMKSYKRKNSAYHQLKTAYQGYVEQYEKLTSFFQSQEVLLKKITTWSRNHGLECTKITPCTTKEESFYCLHYVDVTFKGEFGHATDLLNDIRKGCRDVHISSLQMDRLDHNNVMTRVRLRFFTIKREKDT